MKVADCSVGKRNLIEGDVLKLNLLPWPKTLSMQARTRQVNGQQTREETDLKVAVAPNQVT